MGWDALGSGLNRLGYARLGQYEPGMSGGVEGESARVFFLGRLGTGRGVVPAGSLHSSLSFSISSFFTFFFLVSRGWKGSEGTGARE